MLPEITCSIKQAGVEVATISQATDLDDLDAALESFDSKFLSIMNKLIQDKGLIEGSDDEDSDESAAEKPASTGPSANKEAPEGAGPSANKEAGHGSAADRKESGDGTAVDSEGLEAKE